MSNHECDLAAREINQQFADAKRAAARWQPEPLVIDIPDDHERVYLDEVPRKRRVFR